MAGPVSDEAMIERRDELQTRLNELTEEQTKIQRELHAIGLYLDALTGVLPSAKSAPTSKAAHKPHRAPSGPRAPRGERRGHILNILRQEPGGYTYNRNVEILGVTDSREQKAVYAMLHNMKRKGEIVQHPNKQFALSITEEETSEPVEAEAGPTT
jgi:hypothetical protein